MGLVNITIESEAGQVSYRADTEKPLLHQLAGQVQMPVKVGCKGGGCGVCKVHIIAGEFTSKVMSKAHVSNVDVEQGIVLACRVFPKSDLTIKV